MEIDMNALEAAARATDNEPWRQGGKDGREVHSAFGDGADHFVARTVYPSEAAFIAAANPGVVLELVRRLKAAEEKLGAMRPLLIGNVNGDATLFGSQEEVEAFHLKMRENEEFARQVAIEECIAEKVEAFKGLERCSVDEIAEDAGYSDAKYL